MPKKRDRQRARLEGKLDRIISLLEDATDNGAKEQCHKCGDWFDNVSAHERHCDGPEV